MFMFHVEYEDVPTSKMFICERCNKLGNVGVNWLFMITFLLMCDVEGENAQTS